MYQLILGLALLLTPRLASAITILPPCTASGDCGLSDLLGVGINFAEFLLGISGAVALGFFVWGGFQMVLAAGNAKKVSEGFETLRNAVIGIVIIFMSGVLVRFTSTALTGVNNICQAGAGGGAEGARDQKGNPCIAVVGNSCGQVESPAGSGNFTATSLWVQVPGGVADGQAVADRLWCLPVSNGCSTLQGLIENNGRPEHFSCYNTDDPNVTSCVRGICSGGTGVACCTCPNGGCGAPSSSK